MSIFLSYVLFSGLFIAGFVSIREYENGHRMTLLDLSINLVGGLVIGWLMFPIIAIVYLGQIKLK
jgi:VanZ family protein